ncbi:hypothetical protein K438DRAFT_1039835 [Mycena galopus ATCC 62051]|nr:hypothetical protein K438DRAFT_1039835 [Mycena galopus ATCC 62051]
MFAALLRHRLARLPTLCSTAVHLQPASLNIKTMANATEFIFCSRLLGLFFYHRRTICRCPFNCNSILNSYGYPIKPSARP